MAVKADKYEDFWPQYLAEHSKPATRLLHFFGTALGLVILALAIATATWWLLVPALVSGYAFAWGAHFFIERNRPATFSYPLWSFISDFRMFFLWLIGALDRELQRHGVEPKA